MFAKMPQNNSLKTCRTCLKFTPPPNYTRLLSPQNASLKLMLQELLPKFDFSIVNDPIMCDFCVSALTLSYEFHNKCRNVEEQLRNFMEVNKITTKSVEISLVVRQESAKANPQLNQIRICQNDAVLNQQDLFLNHLNQINFSTESVTMDHNYVQTPELGPSEEIQCDYCEELFSKVADLRMHSRMQHGLFKDDTANNRLCEVCGKIYSSRSSLINHMKTHRNERNVVCNLCGVRFKYDSLLYEHMQRHMGAGKHKCNECDKLFYSASKLHTHQQIHSNEKRHECTYCNRKFKLRNTLTSHVKLRHLQLKHHKCHLCDTQFGRSDYLRKHIRSKHETKPLAKPFPCDHCSKSFTSRENQLNHMAKIHTSRRPYVCEHCPKKFATRSMVKQHVYKNHSKPILSQDLVGPLEEIIIDVEEEEEDLEDENTTVVYVDS